MNHSALLHYFLQQFMQGHRAKGIMLYFKILNDDGQQFTERLFLRSEPGDLSAPPVENDSAKENMKRRLQTEAGVALYKMRKAIVEPVFGQIKAVRGIRAFLLRGMVKVGAEWKLICATHNLLKLFRSGYRPQTA